MIQEKKYPLILIVEHCIMDQETYEYLLRTEKPYMLLHGRSLCNMPADLHWCRSEWFRTCRDVSVECRCPVACCCGMTPDMIGDYATGFSDIIVIYLTGDEATFDKKSADSDISSPQIREIRKTKYLWFRENQLAQYPKGDVLDVSGMDSREAALAIDGLIREKISERYASE